MTELQDRTSPSMADLDFIQQSIMMKKVAAVSVPFQSAPSFDSREAYLNRFKKNTNVIVSGSPLPLKPRPLPMSAETADPGMPDEGSDTGDFKRTRFQLQCPAANYYDDIRGWENEEQGEILPTLKTQVSYQYLVSDDAIASLAEIDKTATPSLPRKKVTVPTALAKRFAKKQEIHSVAAAIPHLLPGDTDEKDQSCSDKESQEEFELKQPREKEVKIQRAKTAPNRSLPRDIQPDASATAAVSLPTMDAASSVHFRKASGVATPDGQKQDTLNKLANIRKALCKSANPSRKSSCHSPICKKPQTLIGVVEGKRFCVENLETALKPVLSTKRLSKKPSQSTLPSIAVHPTELSVRAGESKRTYPSLATTDSPATSRLEMDDAPWLLDKSGLDIAIGPKRIHNPKKLSAFGFKVIGNNFYQR
ncbi:hypothetical protein HDU91_004906 [Kappamyces sp. JEL0680]|nr:hypothetical protein HDU91_004906 [Kappamyces sp. JEL0680]